MVRVDDGMRGVVAQNGPELRIVYSDRGEERIAPKSERWVAEEPAPGPLRLEEKRAIAHYADRALRAYERHEPHRYWQPVRLDEPPYDPGLVEIVVEYLTAREVLPADTN